jgi:hypothetical protein
MTNRDTQQWIRLAAVAAVLIIIAIVVLIISGT